jgi:DNA-binding NarL/FixJ family response regulator
MIKLMLVDDHNIVRQGLKKILGEKPGLQVAAEASSGQEAIDLAQKTPLDIVILDIGMPGRGGLDLLRDLKELKPSLNIVIFSMYPEEQYAIRCFKDGASAYVCKDSSPDELLRAIHAVAGGRRYITPSIGERMAGLVLDSNSRPLHELLSDRELQVLLRIGAGKRVTEIAEELALSPKTVSTYRTRILQKLGMENSAQLIKYVMQEGLA